MKSPVLAKKIAQLTLGKKAHDVLLMDLRKLTSVTDFFVLCSADSDIQVKAVVDAVEDGMEKAGVDAWHREAGSTNWVILDYVDVVLHVFHKNTRSFYNLEKLWGDAAIVRLQDNGSTSAARKPRRAGKTAGRKAAS